MNYQKIYDNIIHNRLSNLIIDGYTECHHILPKSLGGSNDKNNLVNLTAREHFICHLLLTKIYKEGSVEWIKMMKAFNRMYSHSNNQKRYSDNKWYDYLKRNYSKTQSINQAGKGNSQYQTCWISNLKEKKCIKIKSDELLNYLQNGWIKKRIINWNSYMINENGQLESQYRRNIFEQKRHYNYLNKKKEFDKYIKQCYKIYKEQGFDKMCKIMNYKRSYDTFYKAFSRRKLNK